MLIDTHCHIAGDEFVEDLDDVVARASEAGVLQAICILDAVARVELDRVPTVQQAWPGVRFAAGVHPHHAATVPLADLERVVGEALDVVGRRRGRRNRPRLPLRLRSAGACSRRCSPRRSRSRSPGTCRWSSTPARPMPTRCRARCVGRGTVRGVFHCFTGDQALADAAVGRGFHLSFSGIVTFPRAEAIARRGAAGAGRPLDGRDRQSVPVAGATAWRPQRTGPGGCACWKRSPGAWSVGRGRRGGGPGQRRGGLWSGRSPTGSAR